MSNMVQLHEISCRIPPPHRKTFPVLPSTYPAAAMSNPPTSPEVSSEKFVYWHDGSWWNTSCCLEKETRYSFQLTWTSSSCDWARSRGCTRPNGEHCIAFVHNRFPRFTNQPQVVKCLQSKQGVPWRFSTKVNFRNAYQYVWKQHLQLNLFV